MIASKEIDRTKRVYVYFNLHKHCYSVRQSGKVVGHMDKVCLSDVRYLVSEAGRQKVLREKRKNVHAGLSGYFVDSVPVPWSSFDVTYNPYKYDSFVDVDDREPVERSDFAYLDLRFGLACSYRPWIEAIFVRKKVKV